MQVIFSRLDYTHDAYRQEKNEDGFSVRVPEGKEEFSVRVEISMDALAHMAGRAARSKGGVSVDGPLRVRVTSRSRIPA